MLDPCSSPPLLPGALRAGGRHAASRASQAVGRSCCHCLVQYNPGEPAVASTFNRIVQLMLQSSALSWLGESSRARRELAVADVMAILGILFGLYALGAGLFLVSEN